MRKATVDVRFPHIDGFRFPFTADYASDDGRYLAVGTADLGAEAFRLDRIAMTLTTFADRPVHEQKIATICIVE